MEKKLNQSFGQKSVTIDDLKYDELRLILSYLSVSQLFKCRRVCQKWYQIISNLLESQKVLSLYINDIHIFTTEELNDMCDERHHLAIDCSVGSLMKSEALIIAFSTPSFQRIKQKLFKLIDFCPNIKSLNLCEYRLQMSNVDTLLDKCPQLECLTLTSEETNWTNFLCPKLSGLKHLKVSFATKTPIHGVHEKPLEVLDFVNKIRLENLIIIRPQINEITLKILNYFLQIIGPNLKKFHFLSDHKMSELEALDLISSLTCVETNTSVVKDLNLNVFIFNDLFKSLITKLPDLEILYLHINNESKQNVSLKKLKNLQKLHLDFNSNVNIFSFYDFDVTESDSDLPLSSFLPTIPTTLKKLTLFDASLSISVFGQTVNYLSELEELELIYVMIECDSQKTFWETISNLKSLRCLTLNATDIKDDGIEYLLGSHSLQVLELVKYKGPNAAHILIDSIRIIDIFGKLAYIRPNKWFDLRLDIDVFEVTESILQLVPRNLRLVNVGYKK